MLAATMTVSCRRLIELFKDGFHKTQHRRMLLIREDPGPVLNLLLEHVPLSLICRE